MWRIPVVMLLLVGCAERWERPGATEAEAEAAQARCTAMAAAQVPPAMVWTMIEPGRWEPGERRCRRRGEYILCTDRPPRFVPPRYGWVDAAVAERRAARAACMQAEGWTYRGLRPLRLFPAPVDDGRVRD